MPDTTSITDLPTDPSGGGDIGGNITITTNDHAPPNDSMNSQGLSQSEAKGMSLDNNTIQQIVSGLQQAGSGGATELSSRDIPQNTDGFSQDPQIQANYIAPSSTNDYITEQEDNNDIISQYEAQAKNNSNLDQLYDEIQVPILIAVLYFLFQLPVFKKSLYSFFPILFSMDGNLKLNGYLFVSILFGMMYYLLFKISNHFSKF